MGARAIKKPKRLLLTEEELEAQVRRANPLNDVLFKYLFASEENKENLMRLLNDVLGPERRVVEVEYLDRGNDPRRDEGRASFLDVLARSEDGRVFHVEVQLLNEGYFFEREQSFFRVPGNLASYRMRERMETDYRNAFRYVAAEARSEGIAEGRVEGEAKGRAEAARNLLRMGLEVSKIAEATGLSFEEIEALKGVSAKG